jgi:hypothetical protein
MSIACQEPEAEIKQQIELTRTQMNRLADELGHVHPRVVFWSQRLDELLMQYYDVTRTMRVRPLSRSF